MLKPEEVNFSAGGGAVVIPILIMQEYILDLSNLPGVSNGKEEGIDWTRDVQEI